MDVSLVGDRRNKSQERPVAGSASEREKSWVQQLLRDWTSLWFGSEISPKVSCVEDLVPVHQCSEMGVLENDWIMRALTLSVG